MRFVFIPAEDNPYDQRMVQNLAQAIAAAGHSVAHIPSVEYTLDNLKSHDIVFDVNRSRPGWLPQNIVHVAWVQDFRPGTTPYYGERKGGSDLIYAMADPDALGLSPDYIDGVLLTGIDKVLLSYPAQNTTIDFSLCGYIPPPLDQFIFPEVRWPGPVSFGVFCHYEMDKIYTPLTGTLRGSEYIKMLHKLFVKTLSENYEIDIINDAWKRLVHSVGYWIIDYPRRIDRVKVAELALSVSKNCVFQGDNWCKYQQFKKVSEPHTKEQYRLLRVYAKSKINLHTNSHGFGLHSRVLEAMAVRGFIMTHTVVGNHQVGLLSKAFEPEVHFGEFTVDTFAERSRFWLENNGAREKAIAESRKIIASQHLWEHRGAQVLKDLGLKGVS